MRSLVLSTGEISLIDERVRLMPTRQLRVLVNEVFRLLDSPNPPYGAQDRYDMLVEVLNERARETAPRSAEFLVRKSFPDNGL